jgi:hypothetical protein
MIDHTDTKSASYGERKARARVLLERLKENIFLSQEKRSGEEKSRFDYYIHPSNGLAGLSLSTGNSNDNQGRSIEQYLRALLPHSQSNDVHHSLTEMGTSAGTEHYTGCMKKKKKKNSDPDLEAVSIDQNNNNNNNNNNN